MRLRDWIWRIRRKGDILQQVTCLLDPSDPWFPMESLLEFQVGIEVKVVWRISSVIQ